MPHIVDFDQVFCWVKLLMISGSIYLDQELLGLFGGFGLEGGWDD